MVKANAATKRATRAPRLVDAGIRHGMAFTGDDLSDLSQLLLIGAQLPMTRYDSEHICSVVETDEEAKTQLLNDIRSATTGVNRTLKLIGALMATQDASSDYLDGDDAVNLGFTVNGLAHMMEQLLQVEEELADAVPVGAHA